MSQNLIKEVLKERKVLGIICMASLGGFLFGYDQGVVGSVLTMENFGAKFPRIYMDSSYKGWCVSTFLLCAWFGSLINSPIVERFGRRDSIIYSCVIFVLGCAIQTGAKNSPMLFGGRAVAGVLVGQLTMIIPIYMSELAPSTIRGGLVVLQQLCITIGILISYWLGYGTNYIGGTRCAPHQPYKGKKFNPYVDVPAGGCDGQSSASWRIPFAIQMLPAIILGIGITFCPRSPRWLVQRGRVDEAYGVLNYLRRPEDVEAEMAEIKADVVFEKQYYDSKFPGKSGLKLELLKYWDLLVVKSNFKRVFIGSAVMMFQQMQGCNAIIYYAPTIFGQLGLDSNTTSLLGTGLYGIVNTLSTIPAIFLIDRFGRKPLLLCGAAGCFTSLVIVGGITGKYWGHLDEFVTAGRTAIAFIFIYDVNFSYSWAPIGWVLPAEIFPINIRSKAVSITTSSTWMNNFIVGLCTPIMLEDRHLKWGTYLFFAGFSFMAFFFTLFFIPETKGVPLEEMDRIFGDVTVAAQKQSIAEENLGIHENEKVSLDHASRDSQV